MATLASAATGNFTAAGTWGVCNSTAELDSEVASTGIPASPAASSAFTPGAITIDAFAIKIYRIASTAVTNDTVTVELYNSTDAVSVGSVSAYVQDLRSGWNFFYIGSTALTAGKNYTIRLSSSRANAVYAYRDATSNNWSRQLRTTTTGAPAAADKLIIAGSHTGLGTNNTRTVTMNNTATTQFGQINICVHGTLTWGTAVSTNYYLKTNVGMVIDGGTMNIGTTGTPMPSSSTATLFFSNTGAGGSGLDMYCGTLSMQGASKTSWTLLTADVAAAGTVLTVASTSGWAASDRLYIAATTQTWSEFDNKVISTVDSGTQVTLTAGVTYAHEGATAPIQAEVLNLTRNVIITGTDASNTGYINLNAGRTTYNNVFSDTNPLSVDIDYVQFNYLGSSTANKRALGVGEQAYTSAANVNINGCAFENCRNIIVYAVCISSQGGPFAFTNNAMANGALNTSSDYAIQTTNGVTGVWSITGNAIGNIYNWATLQSGSDYTSATFSNNRFSSAQGGSNPGLLVGGPSVGNFTKKWFSAFDSNVFHTAQGYALAINAYGQFIVGGGDITNCVWYRNGGSAGPGIAAINFGAGNGHTDYYGFAIVNCTFRENKKGGIRLAGTGEVRISGCSFDGGSTYVQEYGVVIDGSLIASVDNCTFGGTTNHSVADVLVSNNSYYRAQNKVYFSDCVFNNPTVISGASNFALHSTQIGSSAVDFSMAAAYMHNKDQIDGNHEIYCGTCTYIRDTTIKNSGTASLRMMPNNATWTCMSPFFQVPVVSGSNCTTNIYVRQSVVGDGTAYNGNRPKLYVRKNYAAGITSDTLLATATANGEGAFELLSGTTISVSEDCVLEFFVLIDGTTGWVNIDNWSANKSYDTRDFDYWRAAMPRIFSIPTNSFGFFGGGF